MAELAVLSTGRVQLHQARQIAKKIQELPQGAKEALAGLLHDSKSVGEEKQPLITAGLIDAQGHFSGDSVKKVVGDAQRFEDGKFTEFEFKPSAYGELDIPTLAEQYGRMAP